MVASDQSGQGNVVVNMNVDRAICADMFAANPAIPIQILVIADVLMWPYMIVIMIYHRVKMEIIRAATYRFAIGSDK